MSDAKSGIAWTIEGNVQHGQYLLGEPWFVADPAFPNPRILSVTPATFVDATGTHNGSMKNVRGNSDNLAYDSALPFGAGLWTPGLLVDYSTVRMLPGDALIATISNLPNQPGTTYCNAHCSSSGGNRCYLTVYDNYIGSTSGNCEGGSSPTRKAAVLTCLAAPPPQGVAGQAKSFRPPYAGAPGSRLFSNRLGTTGQLIEEHLTLDTLLPQRPLLPGVVRPASVPAPTAL